MNLYGCPSSDVTLCRCKTDSSEIIQSADSSYYPKSGCFRVGGVLYNARDFYNRTGLHLLKIMVYNPINVSKRYIYSWPGHRLYYISLRLTDGTGASFPMMPTINGVFPSAHIRRIQRAMRSFLQRKWTRSALPVMMASQPRLGAGSCLAEMPADLIRLVLKLSIKC